MFRQARELWSAGRIEELKSLDKSQPSTASRAISFIVRHSTTQIRPMKTSGAHVSTFDSIWFHMDVPLTSATTC